MRFTEIEDLLGSDVVTSVQGSIAAAYRASGGSHEGIRAVRDLLVGVLAAVVTTERYRPFAEQLAAEDAAQLNALVRKIREIAPHPPATTAPAPAAVAAEARRLAGGANEWQPPPVQPGTCTTSDTTQSGRVIPFRGAARRSRPAPEAQVGTASESTSPVASFCAARSAIARKKELTAQRLEVLARSRALLAKSRSLRTSLEAVPQGRHF